MPLGVIGHVDQRAADRCRQLLASHAPRDVEVGCRQDAHTLCRVGEGGIDLGDLGQEFGQRLFSGLLGFERRQLLRRKLFPFGIAQQAVGGAGDVAQMEGDCWQTKRL
jgi:hypothetical protein